jgi:hypothetical protein
MDKRKTVIAGRYKRERDMQRMLKKSMEPRSLIDQYEYRTYDYGYVIMLDNDFPDSGISKIFELK